ncbi:DsbE family thiol:disulfide interchange protein [Taklimakanibacter lacteus]|uniref:DsbE family thiol:disulfide interchange protein n=1 Tax=Taklimakanibacter lacteus TaxID=2268456 RepID=UPI000E66568A
MAEASPGPSSRPRRWLALVPVAVFLVLAAVFYRGLAGDPADVPSVLINKPAPQFALDPIDGLDLPGLATADLAKGAVTLVNVWASWCVPCRDEHPLLMELSRREDLKVVGINYKDDPENARRFLTTLGIPFAAVGADPNGRASVDWGVYGVPESFLVDGKGTIRLKWIGPLSREALKTQIIPKIEELRRAGGS